MRGRAFYDSVSGLLGNFLPPELRNFSSYFTGHNLKVWYEQPREHYEVQVISPRVVKGAGGPMLEIGFHAEHKQADGNEAVLERLRAHEQTWRKALGSEPEVGDFLGHQKVWRRVSELWQEPDPPDGRPVEEEAVDELAVEAAERLAAYIQAIEPIRAQA